MGKEKKKKAVPEPSAVHTALSICAEAGFDALVVMLFLANFFFPSFLFWDIFFFSFGLVLLWLGVLVT